MPFRDKDKKRIYMQEWREKHPDLLSKQRRKYERHFVPTPPTSWGPPRRSVVCPRGGPDPPSGRSLSRRREV